MGAKIELRCFECGEVATRKHHVVPKSVGGTNMLPLCEACHKRAHGAESEISIGKLVNLSRRGKRARGEVVEVPYGYRYCTDTVRLEFDQRECEAIFLASCFKKGESWRAIADRLLALGYVNRRGGRFGESEIKYMLEFETDKFYLDPGFDAWFGVRDEPWFKYWREEIRYENDKPVQRRLILREGLTKAELREYVKIERECEQNEYRE